jgi:hypothetical protein
MLIKSKAFYRSIKGFNIKIKLFERSNLFEIIKLFELNFCLISKDYTGF